MHGDDGLVVAGVRHGAACLIAGNQVEDRSPFAAYYPPRFSLDGSRIAYGQWNLFGSRPVWAATAAPHQCEPLAFPGVMGWPPVLNSDGSRWAAASRDGNAWCAVENGEVLARFDQLETPWFSVDGDRFVWQGTVDGKERLLIGRTLSEPFDHVRGPDFIRGGSWHFVGCDAHGSHLVMDGQRVADQKGDGYVVRAAGGQAWAWQVRDADGIRIVHGERTYGPYPEATSVTGLMLSGDGRTIAFEVGQQGWLVDGAAIAGDFERAAEVQLLDGGGCVYVGMRSVGNALEYWLVTPGGRYGPWDGVGGRKLSADGSRIAFAAWRGREVWRKVVPVR
jgi:hypothetical protein